MSRSRRRRSRWTMEDNAPDWRAERDAEPPASEYVAEPIIAQVPISNARWSFWALAAWVATAAIVSGFVGYLVGILRS